MERLTLLCLTIGLVVATPLLAQPDSLWSRTYGGGANDWCNSVVQTADGGYALAGITLSFGAGEADFWLVRTSENGDSLWSRTYGGSYWDGCLSFIQTADGGFALAGYTSSFGAGSYDFWFVRTNESGDSLWSRTYGGEGEEVCNSLIQTADGGFELAGYSYSLEAGYSDFWLVRTDENGDSLWSRTFDGGYGDVCHSIIQTTDGGLALAGSTLSGLEELRSYFWLVWTGANGDSLRSRTFGWEGICNSVIQTADRGYALAGVIGYGEEGGDWYLVQLDENGDSLWSRTYNGSAWQDICWTLLQTADGGYTLAGSAGSDIWLVRTDENGDSLWSLTFGGRSNDDCNSLIQTVDGGYALAGYTDSFGAGWDDFYLIKLGPENSVPDAEVTAPLHFGLDAVYPNPFNATAVVGYRLSVVGWMELGLYDLNGRLVQTLFEGWQEAGSHQAVIDGTQLPSGVYLLRLSSGNQVALGKVCLVK